MAGMPKQARCPLPDCGALLQFGTRRSGVVFSDGTVDADLTSTWEIGCEQGHVLLLPVDDAKDYHEYDVDDSARLRELLAALEGIGA